MSFKPYYNWNTFNTLNPLIKIIGVLMIGFKPYYNWNTFNTSFIIFITSFVYLVLNLIITGIPSIPPLRYYEYNADIEDEVLNLIITGIPSIPIMFPILSKFLLTVLNLIITGIPSIPKKDSQDPSEFLKF